MDIDSARSIHETVRTLRFNGQSWIKDTGAIVHSSGSRSVGLETNWLQKPLADSYLTDFF